MLTEIERALHSVQEFLLDPIAKDLKATSNAAATDDWNGPWPLPENERLFTYEDLGRLIAWTDDIRMNVDGLALSISEIVILAHEDMRTIASGYLPDERVNDDRVRRMHGLDRTLSHA